MSPHVKIKPRSGSHLSSETVHVVGMSAAASGTSWRADRVSLQGGSLFKKKAFKGARRATKRARTSDSDHDDSDEGGVVRVEVKSTSRVNAFSTSSARRERVNVKKVGAYVHALPLLPLCSRADSVHGARQPSLSRSGLSSLKRMPEMPHTLSKSTQPKTGAQYSMQCETNATLLGEARR